MINKITGFNNEFSYLIGPMHSGFWTEKTIISALNMGYIFVTVLVYATFTSFYVTSSSGNKSDPHFTLDSDDISGVSCQYNRECYHADSLCIRGKCRKVFEVNPHINR